MVSTTLNHLWVDHPKRHFINLKVNQGTDGATDRSIDNNGEDRAHKSCDEWDKHARGVNWRRPTNPLLARLPRALVLMEAPAFVTLFSWLSLHCPRPPRLRWHRRAVVHQWIHQLALGGWLGGFAWCAGNRAGVFGWPWLGGSCCLALLHVSPRSNQGFGQH